VENKTVKMVVKDLLSADNQRKGRIHCRKFATENLYGSVGKSWISFFMFSAIHCFKMSPFSVCQCLCRFCQNIVIF